MLDSKQREARLLQARERLARAYSRLETHVGVIPERLRQLESSRDKSQDRIKEIEELLERERTITSQRQSLSEGTAEEINALNAKLEKAEKQISDRDKRITDMEKDIDHINGSLLEYEKTHADSGERQQKLVTMIGKLEEENSSLERQLELLKDERESLQKQLGEVEEKDNSYAVAFTQDERLSLLKTVDTLIERVDAITHSELVK